MPVTKFQVRIISEYIIANADSTRWTKKRVKKIKKMPDSIADENSLTCIYTPFFGPRFSEGEAEKKQCKKIAFHRPYKCICIYL